MKICAIVVSFNRKYQLSECIQHLLKDFGLIKKIVVVDNASTDGSFEFLQSKGLLSDSVFWLELNENSGGAGGFYHGIKFALENNYDYVWLMDDDGYPLKSCLKELVEQSSPLSVVGPVVINSENTEEALLSFSYRLKGSCKVIDKYSDFQFYFPNVCEGALFPFNGTLIPMEIIKKIGLPQKDYFIWGDEIEYVFRIKKNGYLIRTVTSAVFYHPKQDSSSVPMFFGLLRYNNPKSDLKLYCFVRNTLKNYSMYLSKLHAFLFLTKIYWYNLITDFSWHNLQIIFHATMDCWKNDFTKHRRFIKRHTN